MSVPHSSTLADNPTKSLSTYELNLSRKSGTHFRCICPNRCTFPSWGKVWCALYPEALCEWWKTETQGPVSRAIWRASSLKLNRTEDASWPGHVEHVQIFPSACFVWWLFQYLYHKMFVLFRLGLLTSQSYWFAVYQQKAEKVWLVPHTLVSFMTSLIQAAGNKMAALLCFLEFPTSVIDKQD